MKYVINKSEKEGLVKMKRGLRAKTGVIDDACNLTNEEREDQLQKAFDKWASQYINADDCTITFDSSNFTKK
jgi:hypothetical protein